jgi:hypothetical protein
MSDQNPSHQCPVDGCTRTVPHHQLMDRSHWYMVPRDLRAAVWDTWDNGMGAGTPEHMRAMTDAIEAVNAKLRDKSRA